MHRILFQNGPDAPGPIVPLKPDGSLCEYETKDEAEAQLSWVKSTYGTVPEARAWLEGTPKPEELGEAAEPPGKEPFVADSERGKPEPGQDDPSVASDTSQHRPPSRTSWDEVTNDDLADYARTNTVSGFDAHGKRRANLKAFTDAGLTPENVPALLPTEATT